LPTQRALGSSSAFLLHGSQVLLDGLQKSIIQQLDCTSMYSTAITACAAADLWQNSLRLFLERNLQPDTISCNAALNGCSSSRQWQEAVEMLVAMPSRHLRSNIITVNTMIFGVQGRFWPSAQKLLHDVQEDKLQTDLISYNTSMKLFDWQRSLDLLEQMRLRLVRSDSSSYIANLNAAETKSWAILLQLVARQELHNELTMKNALISALTAWPYALHLLHGLQPLQPDLVTFNASIAAVAAVAWDKTLQLLRELKATMQGTAISYTSAMCQNWQSAWQLLEEARQISQDNSIMRNAAISAAEEGGHWQEALFAMASCWTRDVISYNAIISACEKGHRWAGAMCFFDGIVFQEIRPSTISFNSSLSACEKSGMWQTAFQQLTSTSSHCDLSLDVVTFNATLSACEKGREWHWAVQQLQQMEMALLQKNAISSSAVLAALCRCLQWPSALRRCRRLEGSIDAALGSCELADAPGQWPQWPVTLLGNGEK
ncbi:unnamed protein product, partial [Cladocopium goreaui]